MKETINMFIFVADNTNKKYLSWFKNNLAMQKIAPEIINAKLINFNEKNSENIFSSQKIEQIIKKTMDEARVIFGIEPYQPKPDSLDKIIGSFNSITQ